MPHFAIRAIRTSTIDRQIIITASLCTLLVTPITAEEAGASESRSADRRGPLVVVIRRPGLRTYEKIVEEFKSGVRAAVQVVALRPDNEKELRDWLDRAKPDLTFVIGQNAHHVLRTKLEAQPLLHALVRKPAAKGHYDLSKPPPARQILRAFRAARPKIQKIALLHGSGGPTRLAEIRRAAKRLQIEIIPLAANSPAEAIRLLRKNAMRFEGLWLLPDLSILTPQVFQYAIGLQFRYRIALMGATRPHVDKGALFAIDHDPHLLGRRAAIVANRLLSARRISRPETIAGISHRLTVNRFTASRIRVNLAPLRKIATEVVP